MKPSRIVRQLIEDRAPGAPSPEDVPDDAEGHDFDAPARSTAQRKKVPHNTLTVRELIQALQKLDQDAPVFYGYDYGDHWHTEVASPIQSVGGDFPSADRIIYSDYHSMHKVADEEYDDQRGGDEAVILRAR